MLACLTRKHGHGQGQCGKQVLDWNCVPRALSAESSLWELGITTYIPQQKSLRMGITYSRISFNILGLMVSILLKVLAYTLS